MVLYTSVCVWPLKLIRGLEVERKCSPFSEQICHQQKDEEEWPAPSPNIIRMQPTPDDHIFHYGVA